MSIFRCFIHQENVDSDLEGMYKLDDLEVCEECYDEQVMGARAE